MEHKTPKKNRQRTKNINTRSTPQDLKPKPNPTPKVIYLPTISPQTPSLTIKPLRRIYSVPTIYTAGAVSPSTRLPLIRLPRRRPDL